MQPHRKSSESARRIALLRLLALLAFEADQAKPIPVLKPVRRVER